MFFFLFLTFFHDFSSLRVRKIISAQKKNKKQKTKNQAISVFCFLFAKKKTIHVFNAVF